MEFKPSIITMDNHGQIHLHFCLTNNEYCYDLDSVCLIKTHSQNQYIQWAFYHGKSAGLHQPVNYEDTPLAQTTMDHPLFKDNSVLPVCEDLSRKYKIVVTMKGQPHIERLRINKAQWKPISWINQRHQQRFYMSPAPDYKKQECIFYKGRIIKMCTF